MFFAAYILGCIGKKAKNGVEHKAEVIDDMVYKIRKDGLEKGLIEGIIALFLSFILRIISLPAWLGYKMAQSHCKKKK